MTSNEYKKILNSFKKAHIARFIYDLSEQDIENIDVIRKSIKEYCKDVEYWTIYPPHELSKAGLYMTEIGEYCEEIGLTAQFLDIHIYKKNKSFNLVRIYKGQIEVTDIFLF